jgi:hypothetical protein
MKTVPSPKGRHGFFICCFGKAAGRAAVFPPWLTDKKASLKGDAFFDASIHSRLK